jgi:hypothetical protein
MSFSHGVNNLKNGANLVDNLPKAVKINKKYYNKL